MRVFSILVTFGVVLQGFALSSKIDDTTYYDLQHYWKYATSAYIKSADCPYPNRKHKIAALLAAHGGPLGIGLTYQERGYILLDNVREEIVVSFRGTEKSSPHDLLKDIQTTTVPYSIAGKNSTSGNLFKDEIKVPSRVLVHEGFHDLYNDISQQVLNTVKRELDKNPKFSVVTVGHSMGGALASIAAVSLRWSLPSTTDIKLYTYGQPRTGNKDYVDLVNNMRMSTSKSFISYRVTNANDPVTLIPKSSPSKIEYWHHGIEYYQHGDTNKSSDVNECEQNKASMNEGEDPQCQLQNYDAVWAVPDQWQDRHSRYLG